MFCSCIIPLRGKLFFATLSSSLSLSLSLCFRKRGMGYTVLGSVSKKLIFKVIHEDNDRWTFFLSSNLFFYYSSSCPSEFLFHGNFKVLFLFPFSLSPSVTKRFCFETRCRRRHRLCNISEGIIYQVIERRTGNVE